MESKIFLLGTKTNFRHYSLKIGYHSIYHDYIAIASSITSCIINNTKLLSTTCHRSNDMKASGNQPFYLYSPDSILGIRKPKTNSHRQAFHAHTAMVQYFPFDKIPSKLLATSKLSVEQGKTVFHPSNEWCASFEAIEWSPTVESF
jgi:hypothetical protein